jgi:hypothetical protein
MAKKNRPVKGAKGMKVLNKFGKCAKAGPIGLLLKSSQRVRVICTLTHVVCVSPRRDIECPLVDATYSRRCCCTRQISKEGTAEDVQGRAGDGCLRNEERQHQAMEYEDDTSR